MLASLQRFFQRVDNNALFQSFIIFVIIISALSVGAHTYNLPAWCENLLLLLDSAITLFFLVEIIIRYIAAKSFKKFFSSGWNIFDVVIVVGSLIPVAGSTVLLARLLRIFRVLRLVSMVPELRMLVNALFKALPRMGHIALLMFVIFYIYAAVGSMLFTHINGDLWRDVSIAMLTLFRIATFEDWTDVMYETMTVYPLSWIYYLSFIFLTAFIFLNMMVGVVLEVMSKEQVAFDLETQPDGDRPATKGQLQQLEGKLDHLTRLLGESKG